MYSTGLDVTFFFLVPRDEPGGSMKGLGCYSSFVSSTLLESIVFNQNRRSVPQTKVVH